ncbi:MAG: hypothetical protein AEth_01440 [Candidatus Argoarchaeum ethanivorans]|uniref:Alanyl-tRNA synthetase class IIc N-terminal domain-containing protein n=1 Tax=Candidatus Argoarchaeum ethanivorans TaxID=2608793 RepID=A0A8B3S1Z6_9EURY|nr:MAG: hypothetical protein AEth_01440 [Candidatus Argoarchaeum ethanivorans]
MTEKLFRKNPYLTDVHAKVMDIKNNSVMLDKTILYPASGGQEGDLGLISDLKVIDSSVVGLSNIYHELESPPSFGVGDMVNVNLYWERRYSIMKLHSAVHIAYLLLKEIGKTGGQAGANVSSHKGRIDVFSKESIQPYLEQINEEINNIISNDLVIIVEPDKTDAEIWWWKLESYKPTWCLKCGGTHPKKTSEIGEVSVKRKNVGKGKERLELKLTKKI